MAANSNGSLSKSRLAAVSFARTDPLPRENFPRVADWFRESVDAFFACIVTMKHQTSGRRRRRKETLIHH